MADDTTDPASRPPDFRTETIEKLGAFVDAGSIVKTTDWFVAALLTFLQKALQGIFAAFGWLAAQIIRAVAKGLEAADPAFGEVAKAGIEALFGVSTSAASFTRLSDRGSREGLKQDVGRTMMSAITGSAGDGAGGELEPTLAPTERYLGAIANFAIEGWVMGLIVELESLGYLEEFGELKDTVARMFGFGRLTRRILGPLINALITTPAQWAVNKTYRPARLTPADAIRQFLRGRWTVDQMREELARAGYSDERIDALVNAQQKFFSPGDVRTFVDREFWTRDQGLQHLRDQGYDEDAAGAALRLEGLHRLEQLEAQEATAIISSYASADIERADFVELLNAHVSTSTERALLTELGDLRRALNIKHLTSSQAAACVKAEILAYIDYRAALRREGYDEDAITALELLLRSDIDKQHTIEQHRAAADAERAAEKTARDQAAAAKRAQLAADQELARLGSAGTLERAVIRGLIPIARYQEVLDPKYDADTVGILVSLVEQERADYIAQQKKAADAEKAAANRNVNIGELESAVREHTLTIDQFRARLEYLKFSQADADLLTSTLQAKLADEAAAAQKRAEAAAKAKQRSIDLSRFEQLVRRGHRTIAEYSALLASLGYDEADRAAMAELLQLKINDDAKAAAARAALDAKRKPGELTIAEFRRAVVLGVKTSDQFDSFLTSLQVSADEHALLMAELADDVSTADAARKRRALADARTDARALSLSTVRQARRLGIITPATYQQRLERDGYTADDVAIEMDLLMVEIGAVQGARQQADQVDQTVPGKGLTLAQLARAVKFSEATLEQYHARAIELGLSGDSADTLTRVLGDELAATKAAQARRTQIGSTLDAQKVSLSALEDQVRAGTLAIDAYIDQLVQLGISLEDAELLASLLSDELAGAAPVPGGSTV